MPHRIEKTDAEWRECLSENEYRVLREKGTERAFTGASYSEKSEVLLSWLWNRPFLL